MSKIRNDQILTGSDVGDIVELIDIGGGTPGMPAIDGSLLTGVGGTGDITSSTGTSIDNSIVRFDGTSGDTIQQSTLVVDDSGAFSGAGLKQTKTASTSRSITSSDLGVLIVFQSSSKITVTLPEQATEALPEGFTVALRQAGAGQIEIVTQGSDTLNNIDGHNGSEGQFALITVVLETAGTPNSWILDGRTASVI